MAIDFRTKFDLTAIAISWIFIFSAFILQFVYALRLLEIVLPDNVIGKYKPKDQIGESWWPTDWNIPSTFAHVLYIVAPPTRLQPGQFDIVREVKEGAGPDPFGAAGEQLHVGGAAAPSAPANDAAAQAVYLDSVFEWALSDQVFEGLSEESQQTVKDQFAAFAGAKRTGNESEAAQTFKSCILALESMIAFEGMQGGAPDAGYSSGGMSSGSEDEEVQDYTWEGRKVAGKTEPNPSFSTAKGMEPWRMVSSIQAVLCGAWVFLILAMVIDVFCGDQAFVTGPHWSKPPMTRMSLPKHELGTPFGFPWAAGSKPFIPEQMAWHEEKREAHADVITGPTRRLASTPTLAGHSSHLRSALTGLLDLIPAEAASAAGHALSVSWPGFFEPHLLACGPHGVAALTPRGVGALVSATSGPQQAQSFRLGGLGHLPPLLAASWQPSGTSDDLLVVTLAGDLAACPGPRPAEAGGIWACGPAAAARLPVADGSRLVAAAATWLRSHTSEPQLHAAFIDKATPDLVALFALIGAGEAASWMPLGEVHVPDDHKASLAFMGDGELLITTAAGALLRRRLQDGAIMADSIHSFGGSHSSLQWQGACGLHGGPEGSLAHLRLHRAQGSQVWRPEIVATGLKALEAVWRPEIVATGLKALEAVAGPLFQ
ncbi:unnamed protein product, partial [Polarella glacialis]